MTKQLCVRYLISGHVQGVWFRAGTQDQAKALGLTGWTQNLPDGRVEVLACGNKDQLEELYRWLQNGPPLASVSNVVCEELPWQKFERFAVK